MIIYDFNAVRAVVPTKTNSPLLVYPDRVLAGTIAHQSLQPVAWRDPKIVQTCSGIQ